MVVAAGSLDEEGMAVAEQLEGAVRALDHLHHGGIGVGGSEAPAEAQQADRQEADKAHGK